MAIAGMIVAGIIVWLLCDAAVPLLDSPITRVVGACTVVIAGAWLLNRGRLS